MFLPFFPYSSDDGFSITDYEEVRSDLGDWKDIKSLSKNFRIMSDIVINHASIESKYFKSFIENGVLSATIKLTLILKILRFYFSSLS